MRHCDVIVFQVVGVMLWLTGVAGVNVVIESRSGARRSLITCYTCPDKVNNEECNRWAPDIACPENHTVCETVHTFNTKTGSSLRVKKRCAVAAECTNEHVGCRDTENSSEKVCVSCCDSSYCNVDIPVNITSAISLSSIFQPTSSSQSLSSSHLWLLTFLIGQLLILSFLEDR
ncbi:ly6/PLAUR domain-containing protein 6-like [Gigantopelta aegis]|uniref:ly6/PLAUR domain-containing protein 6-like n=1 Tax=Gigantopelta aegis TaxID=1735272 RepID=UPI001B887DF5|nr:ly6/PLAUR domain-containing protein 6-like [Gigantopelta aegis]